MTERLLLVTGATGFVGGAVVRALAASRRGAPAEAAPVRLMVRRRPGRTPLPPDAEIVHADLTEPASLRGVCEGIDTVLHLASQIGGDAELCEAVNARGTELLVAEAVRAGVRRIVYLSTCGVYGDGVHRGATASELVPAPASPTSRSRLAAEQFVRRAGGMVLRPHLVYGTGDVWVVPALAELLRRVPALIDGGRARLSLVAVDDLARLFVALAGAAWRPSWYGSVHHANHPVPVTACELSGVITRCLGRPPPAVSLSAEEFAARLGALDSAETRRRLAFIAADRWYDGGVWALAACPPGPGLQGCFPRYAAWYRSHLNEPVTL